jgi:hypothetical protein
LIEDAAVGDDVFAVVKRRWDCESRMAPVEELHIPMEHRVKPA